MAALATSIARGAVRLAGHAVRGLEPAIPESGWDFAADAVRGRADVFADAARSLRENGVVVLRGMHAPESLAPFVEAIEGLAVRLEAARGATREDALGDGVLIRNRTINRQAPVRAGIRAQGFYLSAIGTGKAVVNYRYGAADNGMIDVFRPELLLPAHAETIRSQERDDVVCRLVQKAFRRTIRPLVSNLYLTDGLETTRDFHIDGFAFKVKAFLYVTGAERLEDGPYCYARGTHRQRILRRWNETYNQVHKPRRQQFEFFDPARKVVLTGRAGDLIVSVQNGAHRGHPQSPGRRRYMLVQAYA